MYRHKTANNSQTSGLIIIRSMYIHIFVLCMYMHSNFDLKCTTVMHKDELAKSVPEAERLLELHQERKVRGIPPIICYCMCAQRLITAPTNE